MDIIQLVDILGDMVYLLEILYRLTSLIHLFGLSFYFSSFCNLLRYIVLSIIKLIAVLQTIEKIKYNLLMIESERTMIMDCVWGGSESVEWANVSS